MNKREQLQIIISKLNKLEGKDKDLFYLEGRIDQMIAENELKENTTKKVG